MLARWSSWGALPELFDTSKPAWETERKQLRGLLTEAQWRAAERTTINAHYTDPAIAARMWQALRSLGFEGGAVLEPGCGAGTFIGLAPDTARMVGVELDPVTASICAALYRHAQVRAESFADTRLPAGHFDATIGNVPFADVRLHDPVHNAGRHAMHNHFLVKSLALTRPGGLVIALTSRYTLDGQNPAARREMALLADLLGAVRLPAGAHRRAAGTEAVTDLLVLRRRGPDRPAATTGWETVTTVALDSHPAKVNGYFTEHPGQVLGVMSLARGMHGAQTLTVTGDLDQLDVQLGQALDRVVTAATERGLRMTPRPSTSAQTSPPAPQVGVDRRWDGSIVADVDGSFATVAGDTMAPLKVPRTASAELRALLELRDAATWLVDLEAASVEDSDDIEAARAVLRHRYETYVGRYGPLGRCSLRRAGRTDDAGQDTYARIVPTAIRILRTDPFAPLVLALEQFDDQDQTATPAAILTRRVVAPTREVMGVETPADAIAVSLDRTGKLDLELIAELLGMPTDEARDALGDAVFTDPETGALVHAPEYLSGDVRAKLAAATARAKDDLAFTVNEAALRGVLPDDLGPEEITAQLGAVWISAQIHEQFLTEILHARDVRVENPLPGMWEVRGGRSGIRATSEWGTARRPAPDIAQAVMEQRSLLVYDEVEDHEGRKRRVLNAVETTAAQEKAQALQERFAEWVWEDPERAQGLVDEYNRRFNSIVLRDYTDAGDYLTLPGLAASFTPLPHQRAAVARMIAEPAAGLFHEVGAGKTAEMVMGAMELRRIGLISKPVAVVPNHMLEQFTREWLHLYPRARILAASSQDLSGERRRLFVARAATNDWDAVLLTQGAFQRIPLDPATEAAYIERQVDEVRDALHDVEGGRRMSVKRIERRLLALENKLKQRAELARDPGITFETAGFDYVLVDELHLYKNLATDSNIRDAAIDGSARATDLHMKLEHLRASGRERIVTGATATPVANSVTEAYVMQRYLRPDLLDAAGVGAFDAWAATFGQTVTQMEMSPSGTGWRLKTRFAQFTNVPEMLRMWSTFADVKTADDLALPVPQLAERDDGTRAPATVAVPATVELERFVEQLAARADQVASRAVAPEDDNMLAICTDGRKAALDVRMVDPHTRPSGWTKIDQAADAIVKMWEHTRNNVYLDPAIGEPSPVTGGLQLVFCDLGTPSPDRWNAYDELRDQLVGRGMPDGVIRYIHEAKTDLDKARLFAAARAGHVAVLIGSTEKMGVGTNVQARAVALWHLDCPWRPADIAQREGRILRQGNQNDEVTVGRLVTEGSWDAFMWQTIERKTKFIAQVMRGRLDAREIQEIDSTAVLSAAEAKAISSGNPLLLEQAGVQAEVSRLQRLQRAHSRNEAMLTATRERARADADRARADLDQLRAVLPRLVDTSGDRFRIRIDDTTYSSRTDAACALADWSHQAGLRHAPGHRERDYGVVGQVSSFDVTVATAPTFGRVEVTVALAGVPRSRFVIDRDTFLDGGVGMIQRIENRAAGISTYLDDAAEQLETAEQTIRDTDERLGRPFRHADALRDAQARLVEVNQQLEAFHDTPKAIVDEPSTDDSRQRAPVDGHRPSPAPVTTYGDGAGLGSRRSSLVR